MAGATAGDLDQAANSIYDARRGAGLGEQSFYKPSDDKCFLAKVYRSGAKLPGAGELSDDVPVLVSEVMAWESEFRCFVLEGKVVAVSPYLREGERVETPEGEFPACDGELREAARFAEAAARNGVAPVPPGVVIDVGVIKGRGWAVIEANQAWGAGIYGCDPAAVLPVLRRVCVPTAAHAPDEQRWAAAY